MFRLMDTIYVDLTGFIWNMVGYSVIKDGIIFKEKTDLQNSDVESLWVEVNLPHTNPILIGTVYRPPSSKADYLEHLDMIFQNYTTLYEDVIIVGDFNLDK